jgi:DNA-binding MarR family transcriptional regulator
MFIHPSTLTGVLRRLEQRRVIRRSADPEDGRRAIFELTPLGRRIEQQRGGTVEATVEKALASLSRAEIECATAVLAKLAREFERG